MYIYIIYIQTHGLWYATIMTTPVQETYYIYILGEGAQENRSVDFDVQGLKKVSIYLPLSRPPITPKSRHIDYPEKKERDEGKETSSISNRYPTASFIQS